MASEENTKQAIEEYRLFVASLAQGNNGDGINRIFLNSDKDRALVVLVELFKSAKTIVRIFAANLCQFVGKESEYVEALSDFIEKEGEVKILLNSYSEDNAKQSNLFKRLAYYKSTGKSVHVKSTKIKPYYSGDESKTEVHFTIVDNKGYRIETNVEKRTAMCNFNDPNEAQKAAQFFDEVFNGPYSEDVNLLALFNYGNK